MRRSGRRVQEDKASVDLPEVLRPLTCLDAEEVAERRPESTNRIRIVTL